jgi:hypothetical protein
MRIVFLVCWSFALFAQEEPQWGERGPQMSLAIQFSNTVFRLGDPIKITVYVRNESKQPVHLFYSPWRFDFIAVNEAGHAVTRRSVDGSAGISDRGTFLSPSEIFKYRYDLSQLLYMTNTGRFTVTAGRKDGGTYFYSKPVTIEVLPAESVIATNADVSPKVPPTITSSVSAGSSNAVPLSPPPAPFAAEAKPQLSTKTHAPSVSSSAAGVPHDDSESNFAKKVGVGLLVLLATVAGFILWRASRRKSEA